jgi:MFS family permease
VSGWFGLPQAVGVVVGVALVTSFTTTVRAGYLLIAVAVVVLVLPFAAVTRDPVLDPADRPTLSLARGWWIDPRRFPDFGWAWLTRFLISLGNALGTLYLLYFLRDKVHYEQLFPGRSAEDGVLVLILIYAAGAVATAVGGGMWSDRTGRRKPLVIVSSLVMAAGAVLLAVWPTWTASLVAAALLGVGYGVYMAVDTALVTEVLPAAADRGKDLGIVNIANAAPQVLAPALAAPVVAGLGGYPMLYSLTALVTLAGAVLVLPIRSVR